MCMFQKDCENGGCKVHVVDTDAGRGPKVINDFFHLRRLPCSGYKQNDHPLSPGQALRDIAVPRDAGTSGDIPQKDPSNPVLCKRIAADEGHCKHGKTPAKIIFILKVHFGRNTNDIRSVAKNVERSDLS